MLLVSGGVKNTNVPSALRIAERVFLPCPTIMDDLSSAEVRWRLPDGCRFKGHQGRGYSGCYY